MTPIFAGLLSALAFAVSTLVSARASRLAGAVPAVAGAMVVVVLVLLPIALVATPLPAVSVGVLVAATLSGSANVIGLLFLYSAFRIGAVGIVSTLVSTDGAITAVISVAAGQALAPGSGLVLGVVAVGVMLAATGGGQELEEGIRISRSRSMRAAALAICAALLFGSGMFLTAYASAQLPTAWVLLPGRMAGLALVGVPLVAARRARLPRAALPFVVVAGCLEVVGFTAFMAGTRVDIAVTSVLSSMFAPMAALAAFVLFRERLGRRQVAGIVLVVGGIALLGALSR